MAPAPKQAPMQQKVEPKPATAPSTPTKIKKLASSTPTKIIKPATTAANPNNPVRKSVPFDITKKYPCQWRPGCKHPARFCGEGARLPQHCSDHRQQSTNFDFYLLKGRPGFPFKEQSEVGESNADETLSEGSGSERDNDSDSV